MRVVACIVLLITLLVGAFLGYCYFGARMGIEGVTATLTPATDMPEQFAALREQVENGAFYGTKYRAADLTRPEDYAFLTLTVRMTNSGPLPQDWVRIEVTPTNADVLLLPADQPPTLSPGTSASLGAVLLTEKNAEWERHVRVTYYVMGRGLEVWWAE
ncbi:MAG: hypothetical protein LBN04_03555 [Oscillospiraceae bacterium]|jgi:hypothetical protein|nr:hypothetical protein [Oscillospiraceae bacterium]